MRKKNTIIMSVSLLIVALFIGTAMSPMTAVAEEQAVGAGTLVQDPPDELLCPEAIGIIVSYVVLAVKDVIESIDKEEVKDMILHAFQYLPEFIEKVKVAFMTGLALAKNALEALYGFAIDVVAMAQMVWDVIDEFVINVVIPLALKALDAAYNAIIRVHGSILKFLLFMAKRTFRLSVFLLWLAGEIAIVLLPCLMYIVKYVVIPGLGTLKDAICNFLINNCPNNPAGEGTTEEGSTAVGTTASSSTICSSCAAAAAASSTSSVGTGAAI